MATRTCKFLGKLPNDTASITVLFDGVQVISGAVDTTGWEYPASVDGLLGTFTFESDATVLTDHTLSITCSAGTIEFGTLWFDAGAGVNSSDPALGNPAITTADGDSPFIGGAGYWSPNNTEPYGDGSDAALAERSNILINGVAPSYPSAPPFPTGTEAAPTWAGWEFFLAAGETLTCTARVPAQWTAA